MIIKNFKKLATTNERKLALQIIEKGLESSRPEFALRKIIGKDFLIIDKKKIFLREFRRIHLVSVGKSADLMTRVVNSLTRIDDGIVIIPDNMKSLVSGKKFSVIKSSHPIPSKKSISAARRLVAFLDAVDKQDFILFLVSGGSSSLLSLPDGISLGQKQVTTNLLLRSGATIQEINCVRKHLSKIKGGRITQSLPCKAMALVLSDVPGDDLSVIGSGLAYCDKTTFDDAQKVLVKYGLRNKVPKEVWKRINLGTRGFVPETPKRPKIKNYVILNNKNCVDAMLRVARFHGLASKAIYDISGNVNSAADAILRQLSYSDCTCIVFGGEPTVMVKGRGRGGRNQELVLYLLKKISDQGKHLVIASVGTDGVDGNTIVAGAMVDSTFDKRKISNYLYENNSYCYFKNFGGHIHTGPTHTNVMDIGLILRSK